MPSKDDGVHTDTFRPHRAYGQLRNTENRQRLRGLATATLMPHLRLFAVPPCSFSLLPDMDFYDRPATYRLSAATCRRLCRFARTSLHWHRLRLNGAVLHICIMLFSVVPRKAEDDLLLIYGPP